MLTWGGRLVAQLGVEHGHAEALGRIDDVLARFYQTAPWRAVLSIAFHLVAWLLGSLEAWLILRFLRSEEHTSELQSLAYLVCRLLLEKKKKHTHTIDVYLPTHNY